MSKYDKRPVFRSFDEYVAAHPEGERYRAWLTHGKTHPLYLIPVYDDGCQDGLPGLYVWATVYNMSEWGNGPRAPRPKKPPNVWKVYINDNDDGRCEKYFDTEAEALDALNGLAKLSPLSMADLIQAFGYQYA